MLWRRSRKGTVLDVFAFGLEDAGMHTGMRENFAQKRQFQPELGFKSEARFLWCVFPDQPPLGLFFTPARKSKFSDAGFVEVAEAFGNHAVVLLLGGLREREIEALFVREGDGNTAVLRRV